MATAKSKSLADIQAQIDRLQKEAEALRAAEVAGVIARIKEAIAFYKLTAQDLGLRKSRDAKPAAKPSRKTAARAPRGAGVAKYGDGQGKTWTGRGKRPRWFVEALAAGRSADDLLLNKG